MELQKQRRDKIAMYALVCAYEKTGDRQSSFCRIHQIPEHIFGYWLRKYRLEHPQGDDIPSGFREIKPEGSEAGYFVCIRHREGHQITFGREVSSQYIRALLSW